MENKRRYLLADERPRILENVQTHCDVCVPDKALSIREILDRYRREQKPLPIPVEYDIDSLEEQFTSISLPSYISREDALHLASKAKDIVQTLELRSSEVAKSRFASSIEPPQTSDNVEEKKQV